MVEAGFCVYPWDLDAAAADRIVSTGATSVALAAGYHAVRAATPLQTSRRFVTAPRTAVYTDLGEATWSTGVRPADPAAWAGPDSFGRASDAAIAAGLRVEAWVVLTHLDATDAPDDALVANAFGERYDYALCPSSDVTRAYVGDLVANVARAAGVDTLVLEACGALGADHNFTHEKSVGADWSAAERRLLSVCFCASCRSALEDGGQDPAALATEIRARLAPGRAASEVPAALLDVRRAATAALRTVAEDAARAHGVTRLRYHASADPVATGPFTALDALGDGVDAILPSGELVGTDLTTLRARTSRLTSYTSALPPVTDPAAVIEAAAATGVDELMVYHAGLLGPTRWAAVADAVRRVTNG